MPRHGAGTDFTESCGAKQVEGYQVVDDKSSLEQAEQHEKQVAQERPGAEEPSPAHSLGIEPGHLLIGVALCWIKPHLDAAATALAVVAGFIGVTPDFLTQGSRSGEVEVEGLTDSSLGALVVTYGRDKDLQQ